MEFISEYGLFLAKSMTVIITVGIIVFIIIAASSKGDGESAGKIDIKKVNDKFDDVVDLLNDAIIDEDVRQQQRKAEKKQLKKDQKEKKKQAKKTASVKSSDTEEEKSPEKPRVFVTSFDGDVKASEAEELREIITGILSVAKPTDEVVVKLESPGGMVHSYGFASSQLARITEKNIPLTICVDKVAASGGYMMACVADKIISAPFAVIGSIGVVAQLPNFHKLLKKNDIDYETLTAGEYKRTLTVFGENTDKGREKFVEDLEQTHTLFKDFIREHRPIVDIEKVATGEIWFGSQAIEQKLIDKIQTSDAYIYDLHKKADIFELSFVTKQTLAEKLGIGVEASITRVFNRFWQYSQTKFF